MIKLILKKFIKNYEDVQNQKVREQYGVLGGMLGIICNLFLFVIKLFVGLILNAIAVMSDAFNNLTDSFSSIVSIFSAKLSNKKPDRDHPFGHGRIEYIATMVVSFIIVIVGVELLTSSVEKLIDGIKNGSNAIVVDKYFIISIVILSLSLLVKLWMYSYNKYLGKKINSSVLLATSADSISDVLTSSSIVVATLVGGLFLKNNYFYLDSIMGIIVSIIICINGMKLIFEAIKDLLGKPASKEDCDLLEEIITKNNQILGIHDLRIHDYGPGRKFATVHAEIDSHSDIVKAHEIIDEIEQKCFAKTNIDLTIHMDPIDVSTPEAILANKTIKQVIDKYKSLSFHDLRITNGEQNINVIFDLVVPFDVTNESLKLIINEINEQVKQLNNKYTLVIKIDRTY